MTDIDIHTCSYYCERPACIKAQRDAFRERLLQGELIDVSEQRVESGAKNRQIPHTHDVKRTTGDW